MIMENPELPTNEQVVIIAALCEYEKKDKFSRGIRTLALEDKFSQQITKLRTVVLKDLWRRKYISLHHNDGTEWQDEQDLFIDDAELYCDTQVYTALRYKLTPKGRATYKPSPKTEKMEQEGQRKPSLAERFEFKTGEILCDHKDTGIRKQDSRDVLSELIERSCEFVPFTDLLGTQKSKKQAEQPLKDAITHLRKKLKPFKIEIKNRHGEAYKITAAKHA